MWLEKRKGKQIKKEKKERNGEGRIDREQREKEKGKKKGFPLISKIYGDRAMGFR